MDSRFSWALMLSKFKVRSLDHKLAWLVVQIALRLLDYVGPMDSLFEASKLLSRA